MALDKHYDHLLVEQGKYQKWKDSGYFQGGDQSKQKFSIVIPPPNVTGKLHLGHAWDTTFQDIIARYKKAQGFDVLWLPGMDHAGIATQAKIEERLRKTGVSRYDLGREKFLEEAWKWKEEYAANIREQWAKMGLMLDYSRERFTLDEGLNKAVRHVFVELYNRGHMYQGERIINWDPVQETALSNIEVIHKDIQGSFYYFKYFLKDSDFYLEVATTRPETMFADVALVVNPKDKRYTKYVGKTFINPVNKQEIKLIADDYVDISFGTGVMKCTPAHDANDFKIGEKYFLPRPICLNKNGTLNELGGEFNGLDRFVARKALVAKMKEASLLIKIENITHNVGHSERSDAIVEPYLSKQWFLKMDHFASLSIEGQNSEEAVKFYPPRFNKTYLGWMEKAEDWCVSRQIWWGHRIPVYYHNETGEVVVSVDPPKDIENYTQDADVLDTWFSSALWPFSTFGWPEKKADLARYYPTDLLVTGYDIIFFWVSRMIFMALEMTGERPFKDIVIHGLIRDEKGRKMSKSLGNGVDPLDVIHQYGVDSLRYFLATNSTPGQDTRYSETKIQSSVNYLNKIWNASRFILMNLPENYSPQSIDYNNVSAIDGYILEKLNVTIARVSKLMDKYDIGLASTYLYNFVYDDFCGSYLEMVKVLLNSEGDHTNTFNVLYHSLHAIIMMIYPYSPFISEELYLSLPGSKESIMLENYPKAHKTKFKSEESKINALITIIKSVRNFKQTNNIAPNEKIDIYVNDLSFSLLPFADYIKRLAFVREIYEIAIPNHLPFALTDVCKVGFASLVSKEEIIAKLDEEISKLKLEVERVNTLLSNPNFVNKAPEAKVKVEQEKAARYTKALEEAEEKRHHLG